MSNELISIILPIYNVEKYIRQCLESIINQTYKNLEIILVDDGSPDNCGKICDEYAKKDNRIKVIHKKNGGVSSARNAGLDNAIGRYISFIDPDDYVAENFIETLYNIITENNVDIAECDFIKFQDKPVLEDVKDEISIITSLDLQNRIYTEHNLRTIVLWDKIYKREVFENLRFPLGKINEDEALIHEIINNAVNGVAISNLKLYYYRFNPKSIMGRKFNINRLDILDAVKGRKDFYKSINQEKLYFNTVILYQKCLRKNYIFSKRNIEISEERLKNIKEEAKLNYEEYIKISNIKFIDRFKESFFVKHTDMYFKLIDLKDKIIKRGD